MNAVEIEEAISALAAAPFDREEFPYAFLRAFGNKETAIKRLRSGSTNSSDIEGAVLQRSNIHIAVCNEGKTAETLTALRESPKTAKGKVRFLLAADGIDFEAEDLTSGDTIACPYPQFAEHFGFFLPLAGISTTKEIKNNPVDIRATKHLNKLYLALVEENEDWTSEARRHELNQFMVRIIFCFFAEDTGIFEGENLFTKTIERMTDSQSGNTHEVLVELFRAMDTKIEDRKRANFPSWADKFPFVNGGLFDGTKDVPRFNRIARSYLLHAGGLDWKRINPDIFGSMIQAVADDEERGSLGMHYTSVPNILKVLNPLFLDDLREQLEKADTVRKLKALRRRIASIRVFDPACGSGNFLVVAYIIMREIEWEVVQGLRKLQNDPVKDEPHSWIRLQNFYGIDIKDFAVETAKLALLIAEFQQNVRFIGERAAQLEVLPLNKSGQIHCENALRVDWQKFCPPATRMERQSTDLFDTEPDQPEIDFESKEVETYICGNPPYQGGKSQSKDQKRDLSHVFNREKKIGELDYVAGWLFKASRYLPEHFSRAAFVATNSVNQGAQVHQLWPRIFALGVDIAFAYKPFRWSNSAAGNAAVSCTILGLEKKGSTSRKKIFAESYAQETDVIGPYLVAGTDAIVTQVLSPVTSLPKILTGNSPYDGGHLLLTATDREELFRDAPEAEQFIRRIFGSANYINGQERFCLWITDKLLYKAEQIKSVAERISAVRQFRENGGEVARGLAKIPYRFRYTHTAKQSLIILPRVSSERREYLPFGLLDSSCIVSDSAQVIYDGELWVLAVILSKTHLIWVRTVSGKLEERIRYSSALCYNTFPVPKLTEKNMADLTRCAEDILLAREAHFPATIAELYDPEKMPEDLRRAHDRNDETLERIYIGRRFRNDTERLEKLFELYTKMTTASSKNTEN